MRKFSIEWDPLIRWAVENLPMTPWFFSDQSPTFTNATASAITLPSVFAVASVTVWR